MILARLTAEQNEDGINISRKREKSEVKTLTILTPTYNRQKNLPVLYESLKKQTCQDFCWLLIDDGSQDDTEKLAQSWLQESRISMKFLKKENGGKHTALNLGLTQIETELTFIVDSDDWLPENAVEIILRYHEKYRDAQGLCGYSFLRFYPDGSVNEAFFPEDEKIDTYVGARINGGIAGDKAEVFYTDILRQYPFPVYGQERFLPEDLIWVKMSGPWKMVHINECVYISDYLEGGLTKSGRKMKLRSPRGMMARSWAYLEDPAVNLKTKAKMALLYNVYWEAVKKEKITQEECRRKHILITMCRIPGKLLYRKWIKQYS